MVYIPAVASHPFSLNDYLSKVPSFSPPKEARLGVTMWKTDAENAYHFRHHHTNLFHSRPPPLSIPPLLTPDRIPLETCYEDSDEDEDAEIPMIYYSPLIPRPGNIPYPPVALSQPGTPSPSTFDMEPPPTPSSVAPANLTNLLQDVLGIMNTIMDSRVQVEEEDVILQDLTELVVIMQEEAEMLVEVSDLVEEYCREVEMEVEIKELKGWWFELGIGDRIIEGDGKRLGHEREDSGVGLNDEMYEGGADFMDDRSLGEMEVPGRRIENVNNSPINLDLQKTSPHVRLFKQDQYLQPEATLTRSPPNLMPNDAKGVKNSKTLMKKESETNTRQTVKKKGKRVPPPLRDSGLGLQSPPPARGSPIPRTPRWI